LGNTRSFDKPDLGNTRSFDKPDSGNTHSRDLDNVHPQDKLGYSKFLFIYILVLYILYSLVVLILSVFTDIERKFNSPDDSNVKSAKYGNISLYLYYMTLLPNIHKYSVF